MTCYIISYDLKDGEREDYQELYDAIADSFEHYAWPLESTWVIEAVETDAAICTYLSRFVGLNDKLFVAEIASAPSGDPAYSSTNIEDEEMDALEEVRKAASSWWKQD